MISPDTHVGVHAHKPTEPRMGFNSTVGGKSTDDSTVEGMGAEFLSAKCVVDGLEHPVPVLIREITAGGEAEAVVEEPA